MKLVNVPDGHHVVRHCKKRLAIRDASGAVVGVHPDLFILRPPIAPKTLPEKYLSAFYYEFFGGTAAQQMAGCTAALPFAPKKGDAMVRMEASLIRAQGIANKAPIRVLHEASHPTIPSKAQIVGVPAPPNQKLNADLANKAVVAIEVV
ncbi:hypothetical protein NKH54_22780 [Mesorhizobium sp. M1004]|uniref:hypothetical protein n=1 Tax=Mesorhizobium sp. M1004 TaxID=2957046 RepID=UPI00333A5504